MEQGKAVYKRCIVMVADGARADLFEQLLDKNKLPSIKKYIIDRGCYRKALTVFPSTTGPAHIPFVTGLHPGTANVPGYRWLCRETHDRKRRDIYRHRSLNSYRGLLLGRDMDREKSHSLFEYFNKPSSVLELVDYCPNQHLYKLIIRRLFRIVRAHQTDNWKPVDDMVERLIKKRIKAGSECIIGSFFGIDEYSHLYSPFDERTINAYINIDRAIGSIVEELKQENLFDETILAVVSDHGLTDTDVHIPLVDIVKEHGFNPYFYPKLYRRSCDSAVMESGNSMAQLYFKRGDKWGEHWRYTELLNDTRCAKLIETISNKDEISFVAAREGEDSIVIFNRHGQLTAKRNAQKYNITINNESPLGEHPTGEINSEELFHQTYNSKYPDAVNQVFMLFASKRSGDVFLSSEPGYDLRLQYEDPEHHGSHGSLHTEHMHVPLAFSVPFENEHVNNYDIVPTILALCNKKPKKKMDGKLLEVDRKLIPEDNDINEIDSISDEKSKGGGFLSVAITIGIILTGLIIVGLFKEEISTFGEALMQEYGQNYVDLVLFLLTAVSSTPLMLPIWGYVIVGIALGYSVIRLAIVMAIGSALGSFVTYYIGRHFSKLNWIQKKFPNLEKHPWTEGKSFTYVTWMLFLGTASPIPCDVLYVACGAKKYPAILFLITMAAARFVRYMYLGYGWYYFQDKINF